MKKIFIEKLIEQARIDKNIYLVIADVGYGLVELFETKTVRKTKSAPARNFVAKNAKKVVGIKYVEDAIKDAIENSKTNGILNTEFLQET